MSQRPAYCDSNHLNAFEDLLLELSLDLLALVVSRRFTVQIQQCTQIELGGLKKLDLANVNLGRS